MGLVEIVRGRHGGVRIAQPKPDLLEQTLHDGLSVLTDLSGVTLANLAEARREAETACARAAALRRTDDDLTAMSAALERSANRHLGLSDWLDLDIVFHRGVAQASHNPILAMPLTAVHSVSQPRLNRLVADQPDRSEILNHHLAIYQAIATGNRMPLPAPCTCTLPIWKPATRGSPACRARSRPSLVTPHWRDGQWPGLHRVDALRIQLAQLDEATGTRQPE